MDLVADHDDVVRLAEQGDIAKFLRAPDAAARIVRRAQEHDLLVAGQRCRQRVEIHMETAIPDLHRRGMNTPVIGFDDTGE